MSKVLAVVVAVAGATVAAVDTKTAVVVVDTKSERSNN